MMLDILFAVLQGAAIVLIALVMTFVAIAFGDLIRHLFFKKQDNPSKTEGGNLMIYDHLPPSEAAVKAWIEAGKARNHHADMKYRTRQNMPILARALDRMVWEQHKPSEGPPPDSIIPGNTTLPPGVKMDIWYTTEQRDDGKQNVWQHDRLESGIANTYLGAYTKEQIRRGEHRKGQGII